MQRRTELWFIGIFAAVIILAVALGAFVSGTVSPNSGFKATTVPAITAADWIKGKTTAKVSLIEYGDFQCPACAQYEPIVEQLMQQYGDRIEFVFRNFPLYQIHQDAMVSSQAAEAAGVQGKYWEMHDLLYKNQAQWSKEPSATVVEKFFNGYARSLGLNVAKFDADIESAAVKAKIQKDIDSANAAAVDHTPTFFVNLAQIPNPTSAADFKAVLDKALASSTPSTGSGQAAH